MADGSELGVVESFVPRGGEHTFGTLLRGGLS
ncbi:MAG: hypothetical protein JWO62_131 [Acidimicrobiaceae bacterium]|nr:hypothetical protein [Acidimicrobiaceae bacterium]